MVTWEKEHESGKEFVVSILSFFHLIKINYTDRPHKRTCSFEDATELLESELIEYNKFLISKKDEVIAEIKLIEDALGINGAALDQYMKFIESKAIDSKTRRKVDHIIHQDRFLEALGWSKKHDVELEKFEITIRHDLDDPSFNQVVVDIYLDCYFDTARKIESEFNQYELDNPLPSKNLLFDFISGKEEVLLTEEVYQKHSAKLLKDE
tara:strand:+ start:35 stop:661 length:627 start_codon:yes stop_codon:yes gene_type:complete